MIVLYTLLVLVLGLVRVLVALRARALEQRYSRVATQAIDLVREPAYRPGNSNRLDPFVIAKRQYQLALLAERRDRLEAQHFAWQRRAEKLAGAIRTLRAWKGRKLPYTFGAVDVSLVLYLIDRFGLPGGVSWEVLIETARSLLSR